MISLPANKYIILHMVLILSSFFASGADRGIFKSTYVENNVTLETNPRSEFWRGAIPVYMDMDNWGKPASGGRTQIYSRWTKDSLYILFVCPYQQLNLKPDPNTKSETNELWNWDVAEIFIGSDFKNIKHYKEFEISPQGEWIDLNINLELPHHEDGWTWNSGFQTAARIDREEKTWYGAMRIPFRAISERAVKNGTVFRVNMFRTEGPAPDTKLISWQPTMDESFHVPEKFGRLKLVGKK